MKPSVAEAALLYVTDRNKFNKKYKNNQIVGDLLDEIFLESDSRPDLAERIAIVALGHIPNPRKKGYDGKTKSRRMVEAKIRNFKSDEDGKYPTGQTTMTINDVSQNIINNYVKDNPLMLFPYFYDGHLAAIFSVDYTVIHDQYVGCLNRDRKNIATKRCSFQLGATTWIDQAKIEFVHQDRSIVENLPWSMIKKIIRSGKMPN